MRLKRIFSKLFASCTFFVRIRSKERLFRALEIEIFFFLVVINLMFILKGGFQGVQKVDKDNGTSKPLEIGNSITLLVKDGNITKDPPATPLMEVEISNEGRSNTIKGLSDVMARAKAQLKALKKPAFPNVRNMEIFYDRSTLVLGKRRTANDKAFVVFGIPTVKRNHAYYLMDTLRSLMSRTPDVVKKRKEILIVIFVADNQIDYVNKVTMDVKSEYEADINDGLIQVIAPKAAFYPDLYNLPQLYGDGPERVYWRSKQSLDYSYLYYYCKDLGQYFVQLEDDIIATTKYFDKMKSFIQKNDGKAWSVLEFGSQGFIGMTYRTKHLKTLSKFIRFFFWLMPVDWLFREYNQIYLNGNPKTFRIRPPIFLHTGKYSSLNGQVRKLEQGAKGAQSREREQLTHVPGKRKYQPKEGNPPAEITTTIKDIYGNNKLKNPYSVKGVFWAKRVHEKDNITIQFDHAQNISQIVFVSGPGRFKNDRFYSTRLLVAMKEGCTDFKSLGLFHQPIVYYKAGEDGIKNIWCVRLMLEKVFKKRWVMVEEIAIHISNG